MENVEKVDLEKKVELNVEKMTSTMFNLQLKFNNETNGECWVDGVTKEGRVIDWRNCIVMELAEAVDCFNWKHWKSLDAEFDLENYKVEIVDTWHFIMSEIIYVARLNTIETHKENGTEFDDAAFEALMTELGKSISYETFYNGTIENIKKELDKENLLLDITKLLRDQSETLDKLISHFFAIIAILQEKYNFTFEDMYKLYIGKNVLNKFRQNNGYKDGTYLKMWPLKIGDPERDVEPTHEDNVFMYDIITKQPEASFDELYEALDEMYIKALEIHNESLTDDL